MVNSALCMASRKDGLSNLSVEHIMSTSVVAFGKMEHINDPSSRLITSGQQIVASPMVAASKGTGMI